MNVIGNMLRLMMALAQISHQDKLKGCLTAVGMEITTFDDLNI